MQQANIINIVTNKYEPQQKHRLRTVSKNYWEASIMAQNIQLFGPREGFLTHQWIISETNKSQINTMMKQR